MTLYVSEDYRASGNNTLVDHTLLATISEAVENASEILDKHADKEDIAKLTAYKDEICGLVKYDQYAVFDADSDPWQLVYVFDGDPDTDAVCEGYAKAFQYLCVIRNSPLLLKSSQDWE